MARRLLYVGADDEIADLVSRVRAAAPGDEVGFVVPQGAGVFQTPLNFRLINQLCARQGVTAGIVSPDTRTQQLARDAGLGTFTSVSAYEQGVPMGDRRPLGGPAPLADPRSGAVLPVPVPGQFRPAGPPAAPPPSPPAGPPPGPAGAQDALMAPSPWTARQSPPARPAGPTPPVAAPETFTFGHRPYPTASGFTADEADAQYGRPSQPYGQAAGMGRPGLSGTPARPIGPLGPGGPRPAKEPMSQNRRRMIYAGVAAAVIVVLLLFLIVAPSAQVTVTFAEVPLTVSPTIQGTPDSGTAAQPDHLLSESLSDTANQQFTATPTGTQTNPASNASTQVVLTATNAIASGCFDQPACTFTLGAGTQFETSSGTPIIFAVTSTTSVTIPGAGSGASSPIEVESVTAGGSANVGEGQIDKCAPGDEYCSIYGFTVTNPASAAGGTDAEQVIVATASDIAGWTSEITQFETTLTAKAKSDLLTKAGADKLAVDPNGGGELISFTVSPDVSQVQVGAQTSPATVTVTMTAQAAAYNPASIGPVVLTDLKKQLSAGSTLVAGRLTLSAVDIIEATPDGNFALSVTATDFSQPNVNLDTLRGQLTGRSPGSVEGIIAQQLAGVTKVTVEESPFGLPYMPLFSGSIKIGEDFVEHQDACQAPRLADGVGLTVGHGDRVNAPAQACGPPSLGLAVAVDLGTRRVGLATADPTGTFASPLRVLERGRPSFWSELEQVCADRQCRLVVVGLPRNMDGSEGAAAAAARSFAAQAADQLHVRVEMWDERLSTVEAERSLIAAGVRRAGRRRSLDAVAASLILQGYLDAHRTRPAP